MRRFARTGALAGVLAGLCLFAASCSVSPDAVAHSTGQDPLNVLNTTPPVTDPSADNSTVHFEIFYLHFGELFPVQRTFRKPSSSVEALDYALNLLAIGPTAAESHNSITTDLDPTEVEPPTVTSYSSVSGIANVALDDSFADLSGTYLAGAMGQIVYTVTGVHGVKVTGVSFTLNDLEFKGYGPTGKIIPPPVTRADYALIGPVR